MLRRFQNRELDADDRQFIDKVEKFGWMVMNIKDEPGKSGWSYTVGLYEHYRQPEIIIFGMKAESRHRILNWIGENVRDAKPFTPDVEHDWVLDKYNCWSKPVQKNWYEDLLGYARWFYDGNDFSCVQAIWPDKDGFYPWQPRYTSSEQPLLCETELVSARMMHYASDPSLTREEWPFPCDPHTRTYVSRCVVEDGEPIVRVFHEQDGDWQFIGPVEDPGKDGGKISCFHCIVERDPSIKMLAGLPPGYHAFRNSTTDNWEWIKAED